MSQAPWETNVKKISHSDNGYDVECTHSGQKARYGDTFREYSVLSVNPEAEVKAYCTEHVRKCEFVLIGCRLLECEWLHEL